MADTQNTDEFGRITLDSDAQSPAMPPLPPEQPLRWNESADDTNIVPSHDSEPDDSAPASEITLVTAKDLMKELNVRYENYRRFFRRQTSDGRIDSLALIAASSKLEKRGMGMMPDGRCPFRVKIDDKIALFPIPKSGYFPITYRSVVQTVLYLAAWLIQNDGATAADYALVDEWIQKNISKDRSPVPQQAMFRWLLSRKRILSKRVKTRAESQMSRFVHKRREALQLLMRLTLTPDDIATRRVKNLEKLMPLFGLEPSAVHSELHRFMTAMPTKAKGAAQTVATALDAQLLSRMEADTKQAQAMLAQVFAEEEPTPVASSSPTPTAPQSSPLVEILRSISEQTEWSSSEFADICRRHGLSAAAALEELNDLSYDTLGEAVAEDDGDTIIVDTDIASQLL